jgi:hypothetical protein
MPYGRRLYPASTTVEQERWIEAVLANDEASDDAELLVYFIENGLTPEAADVAISRRGHYLKGGF